jgi:hypothetical protein
MTFYGLADYRLSGSGKIIEFYPSREEAEAALRDVLTDAPEWAGELGVVTVELHSAARCSGATVSPWASWRSSIMAVHNSQ